MQRPGHPQSSEATLTLPLKFHYDSLRHSRRALLSQSFQVHVEPWIYKCSTEL